MTTDEKFIHASLLLGAAFAIIQRYRANKVVNEEAYTMLTKGLDELFYSNEGEHD